MGKEDLLRALLSKDSAGEPKPVSGRERERVYEEMQHLNLKPGDKVRWISGEHKDCKFPGVDEVVEVFRVFPIVTKAHNGTASDADENDFSVLFRMSGVLHEYCFDSRRFKLVD